MVDIAVKLFTALLPCRNKQHLQRFERATPIEEGGRRTDVGRQRRESKRDRGSHDVACTFRENFIMFNLVKVTRIRVEIFTREANNMPNSELKEFCLEATN